MRGLELSMLPFAHGTSDPPLNRTIYRMQCNAVLKLTTTNPTRHLVSFRTKTKNEPTYVSLLQLHQRQRRLIPADSHIRLHDPRRHNEVQQPREAIVASIQVRRQLDQTAAHLGQADEAVRVVEGAVRDGFAEGFDGGAVEGCRARCWSWSCRDWWLGFGG